MKKGFALIVAIFVMVVFSILGVVAVSLLSGESMQVLKDQKGFQALHLADAGLRYSIASDLLTDSDWSDNNGFSKNMYPGSFNISYTSKLKNSITVVSSGVVFGISRTVQAYIIRNNIPPAFQYGLFAGNQGGGPLTIQNTATINGDFYYNGNVIMKNYAQLINGTMVSASLDLQNSSTCSSWEPLPIPPIPVPTFDTSFYTTLLGETTKAASSALNLGGSSVLNLAGQIKYYTSVNLSGSARVNGPGTIVSKGDFIMQNSAIIGNNVVLIVGGFSSFANSAQIGNTCEVISNGDITIQNSQNFPKDEIIYSNDDIAFNNTTYFYGSVLAPHGEITSVNSTKFRGIIYADSIDMQNSTDMRGSIVVDSVGVFSNSSTVTYDPNDLPNNWPPGLQGGSGGLTISTWQEVY